MKHELLGIMVVSIAIAFLWQVQEARPAQASCLRQISYSESSRGDNASESFLADRQFIEAFLTSEKIPLNDNEREVAIRRIFPPAGVKPMTLDGLSKILHKSKERVRHIEFAVLDKARYFNSYLRSDIDWNKVDEEPVWKLAYLNGRIPGVIRELEINTIGDLLRCTEADIRMARNYGRAAVVDIRAVLRRYNRDLAPFHILDVNSIQNLRLNTHARNIIEDMGIKTVSDLQHTPDSDFLKMRSCGPKTFAEIKRALRNYLSGLGPDAARLLTLSQI